MADDATHLLEVIATAVESRGLQRLVLSQPTQRNDSTASRIDIRPVKLQKRSVFQWTRQMGTQVFHENYAPPATLDALQKTIGHNYRHVHLSVQDAHWSARFSKKGKCRLTRENHSTDTPLTNQPETSDHNRKRQYLIPEGRPVPFLVKTGIMTAAGQVRAKYFHKFRQINRYVEFIADVVDRLPQHDVIQVVDFGCGKSYLTFATHYYLTEIAHRQVSITGLDRRSDVVQTCSGIVKSLQLDGIHFQEGDIAQFTPDHHVHLAVSLHACDTATDDTLAQALRWQTDVILAVPCCQHELNAAMQTGQIPLLSQHGILQERFCSMTTDAIRAAILEQVGYQTQVLEFIDMEHTAKNLLLRAVRRPSSEKPTQTTKATQEMKRFCDVFQVPPLHLERTLQEPGFPLSPQHAESE
jgi:hypothetical protein